MPVVTVTGPPIVDVHALLAAVNHAVATGLGLRGADVYSTFVAAGPSVLGDADVTPWPIVLIHGAARPAAQMAEAQRLTHQAICAAWSCDPDQAWVQWVVRA